jgi:O-acetyl-ADP-ribose deacetylase (regulator of RNase III)
MIEYKRGDILSEDAEALVNTVNCAGIMGRGIALQFKKAFPENFKAYAKACKNHEVQPGRVFVFETGRILNPRLIINFPTKRHWRDRSRMEDIEAGLEDLTKVISAKRITSIAVPPLGCGLGGLDWEFVRAKMESALQHVDGVRVTIFEPAGAPETTIAARSPAAPKMSAGRAALVGLTQRYLDGLLDPFVTLLEVHKLMYFLQAGGEPLRLRYVKAPYGPYAENLRHVLNAMEGHLLSGYADGGDNPDKHIQIVPGADKSAEAFLAQHPETSSRVRRVVKLVDGFETPFGLELLATVHWVVNRENARTLDEVVGRTYAWNERKKQFSERQIQIAANVLADKKWITLLSSR